MEPELPGGEGGGEAAEEGLIEFYGSFKEMFEFFCKNSTIHGTVRLVCSGRNRMKTAFWTLLLLASLAMLYWQFALMFSQFWAYPVVLTMSMDSEPKMFPAVTICNLDPSRFELVSEQLEQLELMAEESLTFLYGPKASARLARLRDRNRDRDRDGAIRVQAWANLSSAGFRLSHNFSLVRMWDPGAGRKHSRVGFRLCNSTGGNCFYTSHPSGMDALLEWFHFHYMNVMAQLPPGLPRHPQHFQDLVYSCQYDGEPCRPSDHVHFHHPVFGSCYTFNSKGTDPFWAATKPGIPYGLSLILRAEQKEHLPLLSTVAGVKVMIHSHNQTPFLEHEGFHIRPGIATTIGIRQDQVNRLGGNYGRCTTDGADVAVELLYNNSYTLQACLHSCFQRAMVQRCGCGYFYYPLPAGARYCDYSRQPAWGSGNSWEFPTCCCHPLFQGTAFTSSTRGSAITAWIVSSTAPSPAGNPCTRSQLAQPSGPRQNPRTGCARPCGTRTATTAAAAAAAAAAGTLPRSPSSTASSAPRLCTRPRCSQRTCCCPAWAASGACGSAPRCCRWWRCWSCSWTRWCCPCSSACSGSGPGAAPGAPALPRSSARPGGIPGNCGRSPGRARREPRGWGRSWSWDSCEQLGLQFPNVGKCDRDILDPQLGLQFPNVGKCDRDILDPQLGLQFPNVGKRHRDVLDPQLGLQFPNVGKCHRDILDPQLGLEFPNVGKCDRDVLDPQLSMAMLGIPKFWGQCARDVLDPQLGAP
ncbi:epithelial sodium channel subunit delta isoform 3-T4 [Geothlypis trichas]